VVAVGPMAAVDLMAAVADTTSLNSRLR
jgi:hypothetical protein